MVEILVRTKPALRSFFQSLFSAKFCQFHDNFQATEESGETCILLNRVRPWIVHEHAIPKIDGL